MQIVLFVSALLFSSPWEHWYILCLSWPCHGHFSLWAHLLNTESLVYTGLVSEQYSGPPHFKMQTSYVFFPPLVLTAVKIIHTDNMLNRLASKSDQCWGAIYGAAKLGRELSYPCLWRQNSKVKGNWTRFWNQFLNLWVSI